MADGTKKPIAVLNAGDMVRNPVTGKAMEVEAVVSGPEPDKHMYRIGYGGKSVVNVTALSNEGWYTSGETPSTGRQRLRPLVIL